MNSVSSWVHSRQGKYNDVLCVCKQSVIILYHSFLFGAYSMAQGWMWVTLVHPLDPLSNLDVTHILPSCNPHAKVFFLKLCKMTWKNQIWNNAIEFCRIQNWSNTQNSWKWNLWTPHASKQLKVVSWFHTNDGSVHSPGSKFIHLSDANVFF